MPLVPPLPPAGPGPTLALANGPAATVAKALGPEVAIPVAVAQVGAKMAEPYVGNAANNAYNSFMVGVAAANAIADTAVKTGGGKPSQAEIESLTDRINKEIRSGNANPNLGGELKQPARWYDHFVKNSDMMKQGLVKAQARLDAARGTEAFAAAESRFNQMVATLKDAVVIPDGYRLEIGADMVAKLVK
jgi:hypothetical protein